jgi:hypothetical protein
LSDYGINAENYEILMTHGPDVRRRWVHDSLLFSSFGYDQV